MIGGSIPNETKVASIAIYEFTESMEYSKAHIYSFMMITLSFLTLLSVYIFNNNQKKIFTGITK
jgi:molybdate transport system permease protein